MTDQHFALFDTPIGLCAIAWGPRGINGTQLPMGGEAKIRTRISQRHPDASEASPTAEVLWACLILGTVAVGLLRTLPASLATKAAAPSRRGEVLGRLDAAGSACRVIAPAITGLLIDAAGLQAAFAAQAALCFVGIAILRVWAAAPG